MTPDPRTTSPEAMRAHLAAELTRVRDRSAGLTTAILDDEQMLAQHSRLMSPLVWDLAHIGNYEELWLLRAAAGAAPVRPDLDGIYDAFEHPRASRPTLPLLRPAESSRYLADVRGRVVDALDTLTGPDAAGRGRLLEGAFAFGLVLQHEHQHDETMLATHQLRSGRAVLGLDPAPAAPWAPYADEVVVPGGPFVMGTDDDPWAYDNERPARVVDVPAFALDTVPVTVRDHPGGRRCPGCPACRLPARP